MKCNIFHILEIQEANSLLETNNLIYNQALPVESGSLEYSRRFTPQPVTDQHNLLPLDLQPSLLDLTLPIQRNLHDSPQLSLSNYSTTQPVPPTPSTQQLTPTPASHTSLSFQSIQVPEIFTIQPSIS